MIAASIDGTFESWRQAAKGFLAQQKRPGEIFWLNEQSGQSSLLGQFSEGDVKSEIVSSAASHFLVPAKFISLAKTVAHIRSDEKWNLLYRILYRFKFENPHLLSLTIDDDVQAAFDAEKAIRRDIHKMHAFVRFKRVEDGVERYLAWYAPDHLILPLAAPFFERRFGDKPWAIFTPDASVAWDLKTLTYGPGLPQRDFQAKDALDEVWKAYYKSIFNPARIKLKAMSKEMPEKYWAALPEAEIIHQLIREAPQRLQTMRDKVVHQAVVPETTSWEKLKEAALHCQACPLFQLGTQTVFGEGSLNAEIMIVGEQPGNSEDLEGKPFVGPAGQMLDRALTQAKVERKDLYVTNAVKHFKWKPQGKLRIHAKPSGGEMNACKPWLEGEIKKIKPKIILALGATAGTAVLGRQPGLTKERGKKLDGRHLGVEHVVLSWHPSFILRTPDEVSKEQHFAELVRDIQYALSLTVRE